jgi:hypothetical protein
MPEYDFGDIDTFVTSSKTEIVRTKRAMVHLIPDPSKSNQLTRATVVVPGPRTAESEDMARKELVKVLLRHTFPFKTMIDVNNLPSVMRWRDERELGDGRRKITSSIVLTSGARFVRMFNINSKDTLKISTDSDSIAIFTFYEAMRKDNPLDRYRDLFRIIEYFCVGSGEASAPAIKAKLGTAWWIPQSSTTRLRQLMQTTGSRHNDVAGFLWDMRGRADHLKHSRIGFPRYGLTTVSREDMTEIYEGVEILTDIVKCTLEKHPETGEAP